MKWKHWGGFEIRSQSSVTFGDCKSACLAVYEEKEKNKSLWRNLSLLIYTLRTACNSFSSNHPPENVPRCCQINRLWYSYMPYPWLAKLAVFKGSVALVRLTAERDPVMPVTTWGMTTEAPTSKPCSSDTHTGKFAADYQGQLFISTYMS